jgi:hypothetical protein
MPQRLGENETGACTSTRNAGLGCICSSPYLTLAGDVAGGMLLARGLKLDFSKERVAILNFYAETILTRATARLPEARVGVQALASV